MAYTKKETFNVLYGSAMNVHDETEQLYCDIVEPNNTKLHPLFIINHGGGFFQGDKAGGMKPIFDVYVTQLGGTVVYPNYRLADIAQFKNKTVQQSTELMHEAAFRAIEDNKALARFMLANGYNIDPTQIWIGGVSAGGVIGMQAIHWDASEYDVTVDIDKWENTSNGATPIDFKGAIAFSGAIFTSADIDPTTKPIIQWVGLKDTTLKPCGGSNHRCPYIGGVQVDDESEYYGNPIYTLIDPNAGHCGKIAGDPFGTALTIKKAKTYFLNTLKTLIH
jgi:hypothetical protein